MSSIDHYEILIRDNQFKIAGVIKNYNRLDAVNIYNDVGAFAIELSTIEVENIELMKTLFYGDATPDGGFAGIVVTRNGKEIFSGIFKSYTQSGNFMSSQDQESITFYGWHDNGILASRVVMPYAPGSNPTDFIAPSNQGWSVWLYPQKNTAYPDGDRRNQRTVHQLLTTMFANNIGYTAPRQPGDPPNYANRQIKQLYIPYPKVIGPFGSIRGRYQNMLDKAKEISEYRGDDAWRNALGREYNGMQFQIRYLSTPIVVTTFDRTSTPEEKATQNQIVQNPVYPLPANQIEKNLILEIEEPNDKSNSVIFSPGFRNISSYRFERRAPEATFAIIGGQNNNTQLISGLPVLTGTDYYKDYDPRTRWLSHLASDSGVNNLVTTYGLWESFLDRRDIQYGDDTTTPDTFPKNPSQFNPGDGTATATQNANFNLMYAEFVQAMQEHLIEKRDITELEVEVINTEPTRAFEDFNVGDIVTVILENELEPIRAKVREIAIKLTKEEGETITAKISTESMRRSADIFNRLVQLKKNVTHLSSSN
jgi:hypothetical protein